MSPLLASVAVGDGDGELLLERVAGGVLVETGAVGWTIGAGVWAGASAGVGLAVMDCWSDGSVSGPEHAITIASKRTSPVAPPPMISHLFGNLNGPQERRSLSGGGGPGCWADGLVAILSHPPNLPASRRSRNAYLKGFAVATTRRSRQSGAAVAPGGGPP